MNTLICGMVVASSLGCQSTGSLTAEIKIVSETVIPYEAVGMEVVFKNTGESPLPVHPDPFEWERVQFVVETPSKRAISVPRTGSARAPLGSVQPKMLGPGESVSFRIALAVNWGAEEPQLLFAESGPHRVRLSYEYEGIAAESAPVTVHVADVPDAEEPAFRTLKTLRYPPALHDLPATPRSVLEHDLSVLEAMAKDEESKIYAGYARLTLAQWRLAFAANAHARRDVQQLREEIARAEMYLDGVDGDSVRFQVRYQKLRRMIERLSKDELLSQHDS